MLTFIDIVSLGVYIQSNGITRCGNEFIVDIL